MTAPINLLHYPDIGGEYGDQIVLNNSVNFTTAQRAFQAERILRDPLNHLIPPTLGHLAVEAFQQFMVTLEDLQGWLLVLAKWEPGVGVGTSLFAQLDLVRAATADSEKDVLALLEPLDAEGFRRLVRIPTREELIEVGWSLPIVDSIDQAMASQLAGARRVVQIQDHNERALVKGYNKIKHMLLGFPRVEGDRTFVRLVTAKEGGAAYRSSSPIVLDGADLGCEPPDIRRRAYMTIQTQAIINNMLWLILWTRYGQELPQAPWVVSSLTLPGWREDIEPSPDSTSEVEPGTY